MKSLSIEDTVPPLVREDDMQRNMDLIRELLLRLEAFPVNLGEVVSIPLDGIAVPSYDLNQIEYHLNQIRESGYIDEGGAPPSLGVGLRCLTPAGHDFIDSVRDPETWAKTKKEAAGAGGFTLDLLKEIAKGLIKKKIENHTGIKL